MMKVLIAAAAMIFVGTANTAPDAERPSEEQTKENIKVGAALCLLFSLDPRTVSHPHFPILCRFSTRSMQTKVLQMHSA